METQNLQPKTDRQLLEEIHENSRKTKNYIKWQLIITVALVVIPLIATLAIIPFAMKSLASVYNLDALGGGTDNASIQSLIDQYAK